MSPKVSVVTSVYNGEPYFERAIPGILAQTFDDFEFVVVDDGSTDGSLDKLQALARRDPRVRVFSPGRLGAAAAYNFGVSQATGEYIARQDFDDRSYPDRLKLQAAYLDAHPDVGMVGGSYLLVDERRGERYVRTPPTAHEEIILAMAKFVPIAHTTATFRRQAWSEASGYPLAENQALPQGTTEFSQRYIPVDGWQSGTYTFELIISAVSGGTETVLATVEIPDEITAP